MPVQIGTKASNFSDPTGLMSDCHRRIEMFLNTLRAAAEFGGRQVASPGSGAAILPRSSTELGTNEIFWPSPLLEQESVSASAERSLTVILEVRQATLADMTDTARSRERFNLYGNN